MKNFYLSFVRDGRFAGATIIRAENFIGAVIRSHQLGLNPGGEVASIEIHPDDLANPEYQLCVGRLASEAELLATGAFGRIGDAAP